MSTHSDKQVILITGSTNGIGLDTTIRLVSDNPSYHVIMGARNLTKGDKVIEQVRAKNPQGTLSLVQLDTTDDASIASAVKKIEQDFGRLDVLINNAGIAIEYLDRSWPSRDVLRATYETNVFGVSVLTDAAVPLLKASKSPRVINISSELGSITQRSDPSNPYAVVQSPAYRTSKASLNMLTACQYAEYKPFGCKVWAFCPGYVATDLTNDREERQKNPHVESSETSAQGILEIVQGKRDAEVGTFITRYGKSSPW